jgi:excisionase family DNA binding protein
VSANSGCPVCHGLVIANVRERVLNCSKPPIGLARATHMDTWYTINELAAMLKIGRSALYELVASGRLRAHRIGPRGRALRVAQADLEQFIAESRQPEAVAATPPPEVQRSRVTTFRHISVNRALAAKTRRVPH